MALSKWIVRKSYDDAMAKAKKIKSATQAKTERNSGLFTNAQESLRRELRLHDRVPIASMTDDQRCSCLRSGAKLRASRSQMRVRITRR